MMISTPYFVACHDAGGANILMAHEQLQGFPAKYYCLAGPAFQKWHTLIPPSKLCANLEHALGECRALRSSTGWPSDFEHNARKLARDAGLQVFALLDHWVNYEKRFVRNGEQILPHAFEVVDEYAETLARETFKNRPVIRTHNHYLDMTLRRAANTAIESSRDILYVLEPVPEDWGADKELDEEFQALDYFKAFIKQGWITDYDKVRLRLHPSEKYEKYAHWVAMNADLNLVFDEYPDIETSIANAEWVFGCESYGLIVALHCQKEVYSTIPSWAPPARLPHAGLKQLRDYM